MRWWLKKLYGGVCKQCFDFFVYLTSPVYLSSWLEPAFLERSSSTLEGFYELSPVEISPKALHFCLKQIVKDKKQL